MLDYLPDVQLGGVVHGLENPLTVLEQWRLDQWNQSPENQTPIHIKPILSFLLLVLRESDRVAGMEQQALKQVFQYDLLQEDANFRLCTIHPGKGSVSPYCSPFLYRLFNLFRSL